MVREHGGAIDAVELASRMKLHVSTARFHLDALCDAGAIERVRMNRDGVGRPRTGYRAVVERLDYRILAEILAMELGETVEARAQRTRHAGQQWAARIADSQGEDVGGENESTVTDPDDQLDRGAAMVTEVFGRMGFDPELAAESEPSTSLSEDGHEVFGEERVIRLRACPVRDLARAHPEVGCGLHLGLLQGLRDRAVASGGSGTAGCEPTARLEPFVEPELCIARLTVSRRPT
ncbi:transcriptional regulator [Mycobacterium sp. 21AC1]|uniref:helix-turn-helix transcriptional regulator n=1 Tax=[Mycobacterium] appelbergii TaxID=2939269 RepID=UPI002938F302|nr:transcriptional regulator [Mycobacterium sp. 21AC1]MDV3129159.1 transcriptional regulator [Mycobacterium sp. 21AC1]